jgi:hypothetical protein
MLGEISDTARGIGRPAVHRVPRSAPEGDYDKAGADGRRRSRVRRRGGIRSLL